MFPRSKRFGETPSPTPGPGAYVPSLEGENTRHKRFALIDINNKLSAKLSPKKFFENSLSGTFSDKENFRSLKDKNMRINSSSKLPIEDIKLRKELDELKEQLLQVTLANEKEKEIFQDKLRKSELSVQSCMKEKHTLEATLRSKEKELMEMNTQYGRIRANLDKSEKSSITIAEKDKKFSVLQRRVEELEKINSNLRLTSSQTSKESERLINNLQEDLANNKEIAAQTQQNYQSELEKHHNHIRLLTKQLEEAKTHADGLSQSIGSIQAVKEDLKRRDEQVAAKQQRIVNLEQQNGNLKQQVLKHETLLHEQCDQIAQLHKEMEIRIREFEEKELQLQTEALDHDRKAESTISQLKNQIVQLISSNERQIQELSAYNAHYNSIMQAYSARSKLDLKQSQIRVHALESSLTQAILKIKEQSASILDLQSEIKETIQWNLSLQQHCAEMVAMEKEYRKFCMDSVTSPFDFQSNHDLTTQWAKDLARYFTQELDFNRQLQMNTDNFHEAALEIYRMRIIDAEKTVQLYISQLHDQSSANAQIIEQLRLEVEHTKEEIQSLRTELISKDVYIEEMKAELMQKDDQLRSVSKEKVVQLREEVAATLARVRLLERQLVIETNERSKWQEAALQARNLEQVLLEEKERLLEELTAVETRCDSIENQLQSEVQFFLNKHSLAWNEVVKLNEINADLLGHQNARQKIHHVTRMKEENLKLKKENLALNKLRDDLRRKNGNLERELEAYRAVGTPAPRSRSRVAKHILGQSIGNESFID